MRFKTKLFKLALRNSKEQNSFVDFKLQINLIKKQYNLKTEKDIISLYLNCIPELIRILSVNKETTNENIIDNVLLKLIYEKEKEEFIKMFDEFMGNIKEKYVKYINIDFSRQGLEISPGYENNFDSVTKLFTPYAYISYAFEWSKTKEEYDYWDSLHSRWKEKVDDYIKEKYLT